MVAPNQQSKNNGKAVMLGLGIDSQDEHQRVTTGDNFYFVGGSEEAHEQMTETAIKVNEKLRARGKVLDEVSSEEFRDIVQNI